MASIAEDTSGVPALLPIDPVRISGVTDGRRLREVDALRGVAAVSVVAWHSALIFPVAEANTRGRGLTVLNVFKYTPLHALWSGQQAVMVFFVISGFVLALPFFTPKRPRYAPFIVRRITRLWPAYALACGLAFLAASTISAKAINPLSSWFNGEWHHPITGKIALQHLALIDQFDVNVFNPVLWSLVHEMRISLVFPLLVIVVARFRPMIAVPVIIVWTVASFHLVPAGASNGDYSVTPEFLGFFAAGILVARYRSQLTHRVEALEGKRLATLAAASLVLYTSSWWLPGGLQSSVIEFVGFLVACTGILLVTLGSAAVRKVFLTRPLQYLGRISYSLYLVHAVVILSVLHLFYGQVSVWLLLPLIWIISLSLATLGERFVERPFTQLGRVLTSRRNTQLPVAVEPSVI